MVLPYHTIAQRLEHTPRQSWFPSACEDSALHCRECPGQCPSSSSPCTSVACKKKIDLGPGFLCQVLYKYLILLFSMYEYKKTLSEENMPKSHMLSSSKESSGFKASPCPQHCFCLSRASPQSALACFLFPHILWVRMRLCGSHPLNSLAYTESVQLYHLEGRHSLLSGLKGVQPHCAVIPACALQSGELGFLVYIFSFLFHPLLFFPPLLNKECF